jgi:hypothetical protein
VKTSGGEVGVALRRAFPGSPPEPANA